MLGWIAITTIATVLCAVVAVCVANPNRHENYLGFAFAAAASVLAFIDIILIFGLIMKGG